MAQLIGNISEFDYKTQEWQIFYKKLENFLKLNKVLAEDWCSVLIAHLSDDSYRLVRNLVHPNEVETIQWTELVRVLNGHFQPKRSTFADRAKFYGAIRMDGEKVEDWAARLRGLAVHCNFGTELDTLLRDRFILGLKVGPERNRLFEQDSNSLTLSRAIEIAQETACARAARADVDGGEQLIKQEVVYRVSERRARGASTQAESSWASAAAARCAVCGLKGHSVEKCRFKDYKCMICGKKGHLKKVCSVKKVGKLSLNNMDDNESDGHECKKCDLYNLRISK
uniref:CCHC-type domain-containing protein n=1 Tax=Bombyx mori TaxID=7091 RepID=A0A8R2R898_BOMMO|nr:uncharacterized protein LOC119630119 isoform X2 [Bombyx mori]